MERFISRLLLIIPLISLTACSHTPKSRAAFSDFMLDIQEAQADQFVGKRGYRVQDEVAFDKMKNYLLNRYKGVHVTHSFIGPNNERVDCIPVQEQPSIKDRKGPAGPIDWKVPPVPPTSGMLKSEPATGEFKGRKAVDLTLKPDALDPEGNARFCTGNTIPVRRVTIEDVARFPTLEAFFRKGERREVRPIPGDNEHYYARGVQHVDNFGADSWLNLWNPTVAKDQFSLSQLWVVGDTGDNKQTVEAGWQVFPDRWNSDKAALFIYYTTGGYQDGTGCYNLDCSGFVQTSNNVYLGSGFDHYSTPGEVQWGFELQYKRNTDGNWWLFYRGGGDWIPVGYYPHAVFGTGKLGRNADKVAFGGEDTGSPSAKQMGSGEKAEQGYGKAAFQNTIFYIDTNMASKWANLTKEEPDPTCYNTAISNIYGAWGTNLYFGGPSCH
jgi:hypothetical protein